MDGYESLIAFGEQTGEFSLSEARTLLREGTRRRGKASRLFQEAIELREMIFRVLTAVAARREVTEADVAALNAALRRANAKSLITPAKAQLAWVCVEKNTGAERLLGKVLRSAAELLTSEDIERVKRCASEKCAWLFLDRSRGHNRRWCEMQTCGSQHKAKAYYHRKTATEKRR
jgi:predicted RNA-binding Zn ribbon-like protein